METIVIVSDVSVERQISGVATWIINTTRELERKGYRVIVIDDQHFSHTFPLPSYPEIRLTITRPKNVAEAIRKYDPSHIHIATEGTLGLLARRACTKHGWEFTTSYHTKFPEYVYARMRLKPLEKLTYAYMRWFHRPSKKIVVTTNELRNELHEKGFQNIEIIHLGVNTEHFQKNDSTVSLPLEKPIFVYFGRLAVEKNVSAFLDAKLPGSKLVIGDGPDRERLEKKYGNSAYFTGYKKGRELTDLLSVCDVAVFPSKTDTFGLTIIEAMACGLPVAAYDVQGPNAIITNGKDGYIGDNLEENALHCLKLSPEDCIATAKRYSWEHAAELFVMLMSSRDLS